MTKKHRVFTGLSRRQRRAEVQAVKNRIYRERHRCGGVFFDDCDMEHAQASGRWNWSDIVFLASCPDVYWNAEIITASMALHDAIEQLAFEAAGPAPEGAFVNEDGTIAVNWRLPQPEYGGLTWNNYVDQKQAEIASGDLPAVYCGYHIQHGYRGGIGLQMIVDAEVLSRKVIEAAIADFRAKGEQEWTSPEQATTARLITAGYFKSLLSD